MVTELYTRMHATLLGTQLWLQLCRWSVGVVGMVWVRASAERLPAALFYSVILLLEHNSRSKCQDTNANAAMTANRTNETLSMSRHHKRALPDTALIILGSRCQFLPAAAKCRDHQVGI